jgi:hypothetical protein
VKGRTHVTKVLAALAEFGLIFAVLAAILLSSAHSHAQEAAHPHQPGPGETLYLQLSSVELDPSRVFGVRDAAIDRPALHITLEDGAIAFTRDVQGKITGAFFAGEGEVLLTPPNDVERRSMSLYTGMAILEERFSTAYFRFNDNTAAELQPGLRAANEPEQFAARYNDAARNLANVDAMRLLATFIRTTSGNAATVDDRMLHVRLEGEKLGVFDVSYDSLGDEQVQAGQTKTASNGLAYFDVWTSFAVEDAQRGAPAGGEAVQARTSEVDPGEDWIQARKYIIDARVKPPKQVDASVEMQLEVVHEGSRFMIFELSRFLQLKSVEADNKPVEFIQNPAIEGTRLARSGDDIIGVILPEPPHKGQKITLRFVYGGEVLAEAGSGLLYVGARGNWYPNRGLAMANFDLTFHYPPGWTLVATGEPAPIAASTNSGQTELRSTNNEQVSRFVSQRLIPVAGFNLGKYVRASALAGNITVETFATSGVEKTFEGPSMQSSAIGPGPSLNPPAIPFAPSPARNAEGVAETTARAIDYYAARFGPFPYSRLSLTQMPGRESQGWPGLIFLSSYAFVTPGSRDTADALSAQLVPAHEAAHQWWGDLVMWATYRDQWFSEGLANYCALMMLQEKNPTAFRQLMEKYRVGLITKDKEGNLPKDAGPVTLGSRLLSSQFPEGYEAINYGRGTWLFHMLRSMLADASETGTKASRRDSGEEPFVRSLRKVRERYEGKAITTRELLEVFAEDLPPSLRYEGKASLDWFIDGWVNGTSLPKLELHNVKFATKENTIVATGVIHQEDAPDDLVTSVPIYAVAGGRNPILLGRVFADGPETPFHLSAPAGTHKLLLDPNGTVLTTPK